MGDDLDVNWTIAFRNWIFVSVLPIFTVSWIPFLLHSLLWFTVKLRMSFVPVSAFYTQMFFQDFNQDDDELNKMCEKTDGIKMRAETNLLCWQRVKRINIGSSVIFYATPFSCCWKIRETKYRSSSFLFITGLSFKIRETTQVYSNRQCIFYCQALVSNKKLKSHNEHTL